MKNQLQKIKENSKPKNKFWKIVAKIGFFALGMVLKNQKGINPADIDKGNEIANKTIENEFN